MNKPQTKAFSYIRFSSPQQAEGDSYNRQHRLAVAYCKENKLDLVSDTEYTFFDSAKSAFDGTNVDANSELRRFLNLVETQAIPRGSVLIVESLDRLSRQSLREALPRFIDLLNAGITIHSLNDNRTYTEEYNQFDLFQSIMEMARSHGESLNKSIRVGEAWQKKQDAARATNKPLGKTKPAWLDLTGDPATPFVINAKAELVRRMFQLTLDGYGKSRIAQTFNEEGIPAFKGGTWGMSSVDQILQSPTVLGIYQPYTGKGSARVPRGDPINYYPPIIDKTLFDSARAAVTARFIARGGKQSPRFQIWQGIAKCYLCGGAMHTFNKGAKSVATGYIRCYNAKKRACTAKQIRLDHTELAFKEMLAKLNVLALVQSSARAISAKLDAVMGELIGERTKLAAFTADYNDHVSPTIRNLIYATEATIARLEASEATLQAELAADQVIDKADFFARLDLESYPGRARANGILKRLKVEVMIDTTTPRYHVRKDSQPVFDLHFDRFAKLVSTPHTPEQFETMKQQDAPSLSSIMEYHRKRRQAAGIAEPTWEPGSDNDVGTHADEQEAWDWAGAVFDPDELPPGRR
jgi:DNA invertase Pin-like site-specific DNA recombinase